VQFSVKVKSQACLTEDKNRSTEYNIGVSPPCLLTPEALPKPFYIPEIKQLKTYLYLLSCCLCAKWPLHSCPVIWHSADIQKLHNVLLLIVFGTGH